MGKESIIEHLLLRRLQELTTEQENQYIAEWAAKTPENQAVLDRFDTQDHFREDLDSLFTLVDHEEGQMRLQRMKAHIQDATNKPAPAKKRIIRWIPYAAAASLIMLASAWFFLQEPAGVDPSYLSSQVNDRQPGGNRAILQLADGRRITLDQTQKGIIIDQDKVLYDNGTSLTSLRDGEQASALKEPTLLALSTPNGGTYQITLSDGTNVWLNAASTLRYPNKFDDDMRVVELEGEAFFDVSSSSGKRIPFFVKTAQQTVEVLGTQFNISAYPDETETKTTLVEGVVRVELSALHSGPAAVHQPLTTLNPGQQATTEGATIGVATVSTNQYTAWKDGLFYLKRTPLEEIMRQVSRWYDVEVVYKGDIPKETFSGKVDRNVTLRGVLAILQSSAIDVKLEGNKLMIAPVEYKEVN